MDGNFIFMYLNQNWCRMREKTLKLKHLYQETWSQACARTFGKNQNSIQCLKIMVVVQISWFHARMEWKKIYIVSDTWQDTSLISRRISEEVLERCVVSGSICGWNESLIGFSMWNFLYREITTKQVSCEILVNFWFSYLYLKLFLHENQYI